MKLFLAQQQAFYPYFNGVTIQNNRIDQCDRTGIKRSASQTWISSDTMIRIKPDMTPIMTRTTTLPMTACVITTSAIKIRHREVFVFVGNYLSDIGGDGILICEAQGAVC